jgi:uncharacterized protein Yka (UPF0111/DUF47 family)
MAAKASILKELQAEELLAPPGLREGIAANARAKYYLSLLQLAQAHAESPEIAGDLHEERESCGIDDASLDEVVPSSRRSGEDTYQIRGVKSIVTRALEDVGRMIAPLREASHDQTEAFETRLRQLGGRADVGSSTASRRALASLSASNREEADSVHLLVMDVHKELHDLESRSAPESVEGVRAFGLQDEDRPLVEAFDRGVQRTRKLKFQHPGLSSTASRSGPRLTIENDLGETTAHVLIVRIEGLRSEIVHSDIHLPRLRFFQESLSKFSVTWNDTSARAPRGKLDTDLFYECVGAFVAKDAAEQAAFLEWVGSRLVFLIDWNRARKQLRSFVNKDASLTLLRDAAAEELGHRAFLEMGGARLVYDAMAAVMRNPLRFGERLDGVLGAETASSFLAVVFRITAHGMLEGRSRSLIAEQVRAEFASAYQAGGDRLLGLLLEHARMVVELAGALRDVVGKSGSERGEIAQAAKERERKADQWVAEVRRVVSRSTTEHATIRPVIDAADDAADGLEEASFLLAILPENTALGSEYEGALRDLVACLLSSSEAYLAALQAAGRVRSRADKDAIYPFLETIERVVAVEHETDRVEREAIAGLARGSVSDGRIVIVAARAASALEDAADALMHAAYRLREYTLGEEP